MIVHKCYFVMVFDCLCFNPGKLNDVIVGIKFAVFIRGFKEKSYFIALFPGIVLPCDRCHSDVYMSP